MAWVGMGWTEFIAALAVFFLSHSVPARPPVKPWLVQRLGHGGFTLVYSALSVAVLGWLIVAAARTPYVELWVWEPWQSHVPLVGMAVVCLILAFSIGRPNPFSFGGMKNESFDPARPGIIRWMRHPLLVALALWGAIHMVPNGNLAHVLLFGLFAGFALVGMRIIDRRNQHLMGEKEWQALADKVAQGPFLPRPKSWWGTLVRLGVAAALYYGLIVLHPWLFGVHALI